MAEQADYREQRDRELTLRVRELARELPQSASDFLRSITMSTRPLTRLAYAIDLGTFFRFLHAERAAFGDKEPSQYTTDDVAALSRSDITAYIEYLTLYLKDNDPNKRVINHELSIKRKLCSVRSFYEYLFKNQLITSNVPQLVDLPKIHEKPIIRLQQAEIERILSIAQTGDQLGKRQKAWHSHTAKRDYALLMLFLGTGIRVSECVGINISDIDLEDNAFLVTRKGGDQMVLYFPPEVAEALAVYMEERQTIEALPGHEDALFLSTQRRRITQRAIEYLVKKYAAVAAPLKPKISPHKLRSTYATNLYQETGDIYLVAQTLGHSSVDTTRRHYADMTDARRREAARHVFLPAAEDMRADDQKEPNEAEKPAHDE